MSKVKDNKHVNPDEKVDEMTDVQEEKDPKDQPEAEKKKTKKSRKQAREEKALTEQLEQLREENAGLKENHVRLMAEFDNFRKRTRKEKEDLLKYGSEGVLKALLPILDDFGRTMEVMEKTDNLDSVKKGVGMVNHKIDLMLERQGLKAIESIGKDFDPNFHEAVTTIPAPDESQVGKVIDEAEKGYLLHDKVIRFSKVIVGE